ncbi:glycosyltransferase family 25 protein [Ferrovibrio terrae]|uniref:glycosyltransferase family 25 protein n=1 Tax=Ferrovibrio terrae TaxID=2594003 RepID=UPI003137BCAD
MANFDLRYINLDQATQRRTMVEQSYGQSRFSQRWSFERFSAVSAESDLVRDAPGRLSGPYKGNFLSHMTCVRQSLDSDAHLFVVEDDVQFCDQTGPILEGMVDTMAEDAWDVIRTEISLLSAVDFPKIYKLSVSAAGREKVRLLNLGGIDCPGTGASAYIVNRQSKRKFIQMMDAMVVRNGGLNAPFDVCLHEMIRHKFLLGYVTVPFLTAPSFHADETQAPVMTADQATPQDEMLRRFNQKLLELMSAFRRLVWIGYTPDKVLPGSYGAGNDLFRMTEQDVLYQKISSWMLILQQNIPYSSDFRLQPPEITRDISPYCDGMAQ